MGDAATLMLDPRIRDWVLLPLTGMIIFVQLLRTIVMQMLAKSTVKEAEEVAQRAVLERAQRARMAAPFLSKDAFLARKTWLMGRKERGLRTKPEAQTPDTSAMMGPMQTQAVFYLSNIGFLFLVQSLFTGFVLVKLPFSLTERFRSVTQRDVAQALELLDPALVTSFSWYMMCMYGCSGIITLVLGGKSSEFADQSAALMGQMGMAGAGRPQAWNGAVAYKAERAQLRIAEPGPSALIETEQCIADAYRARRDVEVVAAERLAAKAKSRA